MGKEHLIPAKKGEVRNPNGRAKGSKNKSTIFKELLATKTNNGLTNEQILLKKIIQLASDGDLKAIQTIFDGAYGKDKQTVEQTTIDIRPPKIEFFSNDEDTK